MITSPRGVQLAGSLAMTLKHIHDHDAKHPAEVDELLRAMLAHIRSARSHLLLEGAAP
jgi:hypothetical protein